MPEAEEREQLDEGTKEVQGEDACILRPARRHPRVPTGNIAVKEETESHSPKLLGLWESETPPNAM